jgi:hypothetical protein
MYLSCSCGDYRRRHKPTDVTMVDARCISAIGPDVAICDVSEANGSEERRAPVRRFLLAEDATSESKSVQPSLAADPTGPAAATSLG